MEIRTKKASPQKILATQEQFWSALAIKEPRDWQLLFSRQIFFMACSPGEADQIREEFITTLIALPLSLGEIVGEDIKVHLFESVAILTPKDCAMIFPQP